MIRTAKNVNLGKSDLISPEPLLIKNIIHCVRKVIEHTGRPDIVSGHIRHSNDFENGK